MWFLHTIAQKLESFATMVDFLISQLSINGVCVISNKTLVVEDFLDF